MHSSEKELFCEVNEENVDISNWKSLCWMKSAIALCLAQERSPRSRKWLEWGKK